MTNEVILALVVTAVDGDERRLPSTLTAARALKPAGLIDCIKVIEAPAAANPVTSLNAAIDRAVGQGASWIFFVMAGEVPEPESLVYLSAAAAAYDGLWGGMAVRGASGALEMAGESLMAAADPVRNYHMALHWWIGRSHFIRADVADRVRFNDGAGEGWYGDYLVRLWDSCRCLKTTQALTSDSQARPGLNAADRQVLLDSLRSRPRYVSFFYRDHAVALAYTGRNPTLERVQMRGLFYEQSDLENLAGHVKAGQVYVDVGANTGNHTLYFARVLEASKVIPVEPNPETVAILKRVIAHNGLDNVDVSKLGVGAGREAGRFTVTTGRRGFLGTAHLDPDESGDISVLPLDELITEPVDVLKIDVEHMEIDVLEGARALIGRCRPVLWIEVQDENIVSLLAILENLGYRITTVLPDQGYANYLALPRTESPSPE